MSAQNIEKHEFKAEIKQLLDIVIHSLYTEKEIFIRELISNASDALEKLRHLQITEKDIHDDNLDLEINITTDDKANTITIQDFGIGLTRDELVENLGTIAHSGSKQFLEALKAGGEKNADLIGQFGVGFYSAFMVAKDVKVYTHSWKKDEPGHLWTSDGVGAYEIEEVEGQRRGAKIVISLADDYKQYAKGDTVKEIIKRYSSFVQFPINLNGEKVNTIDAIWLRSKSEIKDEEYTEFYKFQANAFDEPHYRLHFSADAPLDIKALLFTPKTNPEKMGFGRIDPGVALHCRKVLIDAKPDELLPEWLRYLKGVIDSADLPLNISRETMQDNGLTGKISRVITKRYLKFLKEEAKKRPEQYAEFFKNFGIYLKEGVATDFTYRDDLAKLLYFESSVTEKGKTTSLADYVSRMKDEQKEIYYILGQNRESIESGPYLEGFKSRGLEVLFLYEPIDEYVMNNLGQFEEKQLTSADQGDLKLDDAPKPEGEALSDDDAKALCEWLKTAIGDRVKEVKVSSRLVNSPVMALSPDAMSSQMRRMMRQMGQDSSAMPLEVLFEINPRHALIKNLNTQRSANEDLAKLVAQQAFDNALVAAGLLEDPKDMVTRMYQILEQAATK
ncbi:molecular chaperone HtpG [Pelagicoccus sp. SDUM812003]|uniref:molecular chaperone HtpG n=1 Tax=Pelagicoccus sp. SDUM812003 TaxID=3041267 RepID=UPI00280FB836|nr:molecular chaperone HtpG [Pelagicoccus sp. SDUM812003]MDQ8203824.1 molecular chaperone HtpG [Pelagicoccus sp. SDUM812003]